MILTGKNRKLTLYIIKYLIVKTKTDVRQKKFTFLQRVTCNETHATFFRKITWVLVCNNLLLVTKASYHNSTRDYIHSHQSSWLYNCQKINRECQKLLLLFSHWFRYWIMAQRTKVQTIKYLKNFLYIFSGASKGIQIKEKKNFYEVINARKQRFLKMY